MQREKKGDEYEHEDHLFYTDAGNYHTQNYVVIEGEFTEEQVKRIVDGLFDYDFFVPEMVGFPCDRNSEYGGWDAELDHFYCDLDDSCFTLTEEAPSPLSSVDLPWEIAPINMDEVVARFERASAAGWIPDAELMMRIQGA